VLELHKVTLEKGDLFFQYTDGINEAANAAGDQFGTGRIEKILKASGKKKPETIMTSMTSNLEAFTGRKVMKDGPTELSDDIAMIAFRRVR
ncbi:MAG: SpoIIE family protein phosphatase, partial [Leptospiraceae bacterium]|nr:SpoIIE family protein phosphatase [Leptospiraceae bacterium]